MPEIKCLCVEVMSKSSDRTEISFGTSWPQYFLTQGFHLAKVYIYGGWGAIHTHKVVPWQPFKWWLNWYFKWWLAWYSGIWKSDHLQSGTLFFVWAISWGSYRKKSNWLTLPSISKQWRCWWKSQIQVAFKLLVGGSGSVCGCHHYGIWVTSSTNHQFDIFSGLICAWNIWFFWAFSPSPRFYLCFV